MEDNLQASKVLIPLADDALSASAKGIPYMCASVGVCVSAACVSASAAVATLCYSSSQSP